MEPARATLMVVFCSFLACTACFCAVRALRVLKAGSHTYLIKHEPLVGFVASALTIVCIVMMQVIYIADNVPL